MNNRNLPNLYSQFNSYETIFIEPVYRDFPTLFFVPKVISLFFQANDYAVKGNYNSRAWIESSHRIIKALEKAGVKIEIENIDLMKNEKEPVIFVANHMSTFETLAFPAIIHPIKPVVYVMKSELATAPIFGPVSAARYPILVGRENPREDLQLVLEQGKSRIEEGKSIIIFPQRTRSSFFKIKEFNTLGIKLAKKNNVKIQPIALLTDAWSNGKFVKDFGKIFNDRTIKFSFGEALEVEGNGTETHQKVIDFIKNKFYEWGRKDLVIED